MQTPSRQVAQKFGGNGNSIPRIFFAPNGLFFLRLTLRGALMWRVSAFLAAATFGALSRKNAFPLYSVASSRWPPRENGRRHRPFPSLTRSSLAPWTLVGASLKSDILNTCGGGEAFCGSGVGSAAIDLPTWGIGGLGFFMFSFDKVSLFFICDAMVDGGKEACACRGGAAAGKSVGRSGAGMSRAFAAQSEFGGIWPFWFP